MMWIGKPPAEMQAVFRRATYQGNAGPVSVPTISWNSPTRKAVVVSV